MKADGLREEREEKEGKQKTRSLSSKKCLWKGYLVKDRSKNTEANKEVTSKEKETGN